MKLSEIKKHLTNLDSVNFILPNGEKVPSHFHITEVGKIIKDFIDCGGTRRREEVINFQLWEEQDFDHRLAPQKLVDIISLSEQKLQLGDHEIEVEYQVSTIGKYNLDFNGSEFQLTNTQTACLASDQCGIPSESKTKIALNDLESSNECTPGGGCC